MQEVVGSDPGDASSDEIISKYLPHLSSSYVQHAHGFVVFVVLLIYGVEVNLALVYQQLIPVGNLLLCLVV